MGQDSWEMSGIELSVGIWEQEHHDARQDVPVKTSKDIQKDIQRHPKTCLSLITVLSALSLPLCIERRFLRPSQRIDNILRALQKVRMVSGLTLRRQGIRVQNTKLLAQRAGKRFHAEDTENDEVISSFKQSFVES